MGQGYINYSAGYPAKHSVSGATLLYRTQMYRHGRQQEQDVMIICSANEKIHKESNSVS